MEDVEQLAETLDKLDGEKVEIPVEVDSTSTRDIDDLLEKVDRLSGEPANLLLTSNASQIANEIADLVTDIDKLDASDPTIDVKIANANQLTGDLERIQAKAKEINDTRISPKVDTGPVRTGIDDLSDSARGANNALANMVGNAAQDVGELGGVAGSAGVALGQMAEFASDAALGGERLSSALVSMAKVAGPIAGLTLATKAFSTILEGIHAEDAFKAELVEQFTEAIKEGQTAAQSLHDTIEETGELAFATGALGGGGFLGLGSEARNLIPTLNDLKISWEEWQRLLNDPTAIDRFRDKALELASTNVEQSIKFMDVADALDQYQSSAAKAGVSQDDLNQFLGKSVDETGRAAAAHAAFQQTMAQTADSQDDEAAAVERAAAAHAEFQQQMGQTTALTEEARQAQQDFANAVGEASNELDDLASTFSQMEIRGDTLKRIFDLGNAPADAAADVRDVNIAIGDLTDVAEGVDIGAAILDPTSVDADAFLDAIDALRPQVQAEIVKAFETGGAPAAQAVADQFAQKLADQLNISLDQAQQLLATTDLQAFLKVAVDQSSVENARQQLSILQGLDPTNPLVASVALALDAGSISGPVAQAVIQAELAKLGVTIPAELVPTLTPKQQDRVNAILNGIANPGGNPRTAGVVPEAQNTGTANDDLDETANPRGRPRKAGVEAEPQNVDPAREQFEDVANPDGTHRTAEIWIGFDGGNLNGSYGTLADVANPGGNARTARIIAVAETSSAEAEFDRLDNDRFVRFIAVPVGFPSVGFVNGELVEYGTGRGVGASAAAPVNVAVNLNAAVIGNRFDITRAVIRATTDALRIAGARTVLTGTR